MDGYNALYQFLATIRQRDGQLFTDPEGRVTTHLIGLLYRTTSLLAEGVRLYWVFDGAPPDRKSGTLSGRFRAKERAEAEWKEALDAGDLERARRKAAATSRLTREMVQEGERLLDALGVPYLEAPSEGEAQAAALAAAGTVWASASEDYDSLLFGTPRLVRGLAARGRGPGTAAAQVIDRADLLVDLGIDGEELILMGILIGTDYNDGAAGFGPKRALRLVREHLGWEATVRRAGLDRAEAEAVAELFRHPQIVPAEPPVFGPTDPERVRELLVERHGFSRERVDLALARADRGRSRRSHPPAPLPAAGHQSRLDRFEETAP